MEICANCYTYKWGMNGAHGISFRSGGGLRIFERSYRSFPWALWTPRCALSSLQLAGETRCRYECTPWQLWISCKCTLWQMQHSQLDKEELADLYVSSRMGTFHVCASESKSNRWTTFGTFATTALCDKVHATLRCWTCVHWIEQVHTVFGEYNS